MRLLHKRRSVLGLGLLLASVFAFSADSSKATTAAQENSISILPGSSQFSFVVYGDTRFTDVKDTKNSNPEMRHALVQQIAEAKPAFVVITGDLVLGGGDANDWKVWESETKPWRDAGFPVFPVLGNHDVYGDPQAVHYFAHFPELKQHPWYSVRAGHVLFFMLDSNSDVSAGVQWNWLQDQLARVPDDVYFLFFILHHPPYTHSSNSFIQPGHAARSAEQKLAERLEQFQATTHARLIVVAGHVHNYERYEHGGVTYIVSGGGGATPYSIPRLPQDFYRGSGPTYHFMRFSVEGRELRSEMVKAESQDGKTTWTVKDSFALNASAPVHAAGK
jgi:Icc-related predicted phosphoesterase